MTVRTTHRLRGIWCIGLMLGLVLWLLGAPARASVELPSGRYHTTVEEFRVKVPGGEVKVERTWYNGRWYFNSAWSDLEIEHDTLGSGNGTATIARFTRNGDVYKPTADASRFVYNERYSIAVLEGGGYRWEDRKGNWIEYNAEGKVTRYGDRNDIEVRLTYNGDGERSGVFDHNGRQILWYGHDGDGHITEVRDAADPAEARRVQYRYDEGLVTEVIDVRGERWRYSYEVITLDEQGGTVTHSVSSGSPSANLSLNSARTVMVQRTDPLGQSERIDYKNARVAVVTHTDATTTEYEYDYDKNRKEYYTRTTLAGGKVIERWYDSEASVLRRDVNGRTEYTMAKDGREKTFTDARGLKTVKRFDAWENLIGITYPDGSTVSYEVETEYSNVLQAVDENGTVTTYAYDDNGNLIRKTEAKGAPAERITEYVYDEKMRLVAIRRLGDNATVEAVTRFSDFDAGDSPRTLIDAEGSVHTCTYNNAGEVLTHTDARGATWRNVYDGAGHRLSETDPLGYTTSYQYDALGYREKRIGPTPLKAETTYSYDARGRLTAITDALGGVVRFDRDATGRLVGLTDASGRVLKQLSYDGEGRVAQTRDGAGNITSYDYGSEEEDAYQGLLSAVEYPTYTERFAYDKRGRPTAITEQFDGQSRRQLLGYAPTGELETLTDAKARTTDYRLDALGRTIAEADPGGGITTYRRDDRDNLLAVTNARGVLIRRYAYDREDRLVKETRPDGTFYEYRYNDAEGAIIRIDAKGQSTRYEKDPAGRLIAISYYAAGATEPQKIIKLSYDERGLLSGYDDGTTAARYTYDALGRKTSESVDYGPFTLSYRYAYDKAGRKTAFTGPDGVTVTYRYDSAGRPATITLPETGTFAYADFKWREPTELLLPGGGTLQWVRDGLLRPKAITGNDPAGNPVLSYAYAYDAVDNILQKATEHGDYRYSYDALDRLTGADNPTLSDEAYTYDGVGNRLTDAKTEGAWTYTPSDELTGYDGVTLTYDQNGSLIQKDDNGTVTQYTYNLENRLSEVRDSEDTLIARYSYDPFGRRLWKEVEGKRTYFLYSDEGLIAEADATGILTRQYGWEPEGTWGTDPLYLKTGGQTYFYQNDHLGTPQKLVAMNGAVVWSARYESFGAARIANEQVENPLRFPGQYVDRETEFYYNYFRYYDSSLGRYIRRDPIGLVGGINVYLYVQGSPLAFFDNDGLLVNILVGGVIGGVCGYLNGGTCEMVMGIVSGALPGLGGFAAGSIAGQWCAPRDACVPERAIQLGKDMASGGTGYMNNKILDDSERYRSAAERASRNTARDALTRVKNQRYFNAMAGRSARRATRRGGLAGCGAAVIANVLTK